MIDSRYYNQRADQAPGIESEYDAMNRLIRTTVFDGSDRTVIEYNEYDSRGNLTKSVNGEGYNSLNPAASMGSRYDYDVSNRVIRSASALNIVNEYTYDGSGRKISEKDGMGGTITYEYYLNGNLKNKVYQDGIGESYEYDLTGRAEITKTDRLGFKTTIYNNVFESPYRIEYPDGTYETLKYDGKGQVIESTDKAGNSKYLEYDPSGNVISKKEFISEDTTFQYFKQTIYSYDKSNSILSSETWELKEPTKSGTVIRTSMGDRVTYHYDKLGRVIGIYGPNGRETIHSYDKIGNLVLKEQKVSDGYYDAIGYTYDVQSRVISTDIMVETSDLDMNLLGKIEAGEGKYATRIKAKTQNVYDSTGKIKSTIDENGNLIAYDYDLDGRLIKKIEPLENITLYSYDFNGNLIEEKNARGVSSFYDYDSLNRLLRKKTPTSGGELGVTRYIYDTMGNLIKEILPNNYQINKDTDKLASSMKGISYTYDSMNRRLTTISQEGDILQLVQYNKNGNIEKAVDGIRYNGDIKTSKGTLYTYDALGRVITEEDPLGNKSSYVYDVLGNPIKETDKRSNVTRFVYNSDGTLSKVTAADGGVVEYTYDLLGRKIQVKDQRGFVTSYEHNAFGKARNEMDPYNNRVEYKYDLNGNMVIQKDKAGSTTTFTYDAANRVIEKRTPLYKDGSSNVIYAREKYYYDEVGNLKSLVRTGTKDKTSNRTTNYTYYNNNLLHTTTDDSGAKVINNYDFNGNLIKVEKLRTVDDDRNAIYDVEEYVYDSMNRLVESIKLGDREDIFEANSLPNSKLITEGQYKDKVRISTSYEYDLLGNKIKEISPSGNITHNSYDVMNQVQSTSRTVNGILTKISYQYDEVGNKIAEINELGHKKVYTYDSVNRLKTIVDATGNTFTYNYDLSGNKICEINAKNSTITYSYDKLNRQETTTDPFGIVISDREYDANGNLTKEYDAKGNPVTYTYDLAGRLVKTISREGNVTKYEFNHYGEKVKIIDGLGNTTSYEYDSVGRLAKVIDGNGIKTVYIYDLAGNKLYMTDGRGKTTTYEYGAFGKLRTAKDPDGGIILHQYDLDGNLASKTDKNGYHTEYEYDSRNLLLSKKVLETGDSITYSYDEAGNRIGMLDESGNTSYTYDANNRLSEIRKDGKTEISYHYDLVGNILKVIDLVGNITTYTYDKASRMETVTFDQGKLTYQYDKNGNRSSITYGNGVNETYEYNKDNEIITLVNKKSNGSIISRYGYTYDAAGRQITKTDSYGTTYYSYDKAGRILKVDAPGKIDIYAYDGAGNRIAVNETYKSLQPSDFIDDASGDDVEYILKKTDYTYSNAGKMLKLVERMYDDSNKEVLRKTVNYYYDSNGNELSNTVSWTHSHNIKMRQSTKGSLQGDHMVNGTDPLIERENNTFDGFNRLKKVERISAGVRSISEFIYNGDNLRVSKSVKKSSDGYKEQVTKYLYDRQYVILETDGSNKVKTRYVKGINYIASLNASNNISYFLFNGHGDVVQTVDKTGEVLNHYDYDIWGNPILTLETEESAIRYAGEFYDTETGLYYLRARYYDPYIGRFISEDSYWGEDNNPLSLNRYTYAHNDPIQYLDPTGYSAIKSGSMGSAVASSLQTMLSKQAQNIAKLVGNAVNQLQTTSNTATSVKNNTGGTESAKISQSNVKTADIKSSGSGSITKSDIKTSITSSITTADIKSSGSGSITTSDIKSSASSSIKTVIAMSATVATGIGVKSTNSQNAEVKESQVKTLQSTSEKPSMQPLAQFSTIQSGALLLTRPSVAPVHEATSNSKKNQDTTKKAVDDAVPKVELFVYAPKDISTFYGHSEIAIGDKIYTYGRYDPKSVEGPMGIYGDGVLVVADRDKWIDEARKDRDVYGFTLNLSKEEVENLEKYYTDLIENDAYLWKEKDDGTLMYKFDSSSQYQKYEFVGGDNCTTMVVDALESSVYEMPRGLKYSISPAMMLRTFEGMILNNTINPFYNNDFIADYETYPKYNYSMSSKKF